MIYFFPGFIAGALAALLLFSPAAGTEVCPEWWSGIKNISSLEISPGNERMKARFFIRADDRDYYILKGNGAVVVSGSVPDGLAAFSGNGEYFARFQKVGTEVEFFNSSGERFWKIESMEYPYLSHGGKLTFLLNGDHTGIRIVDYNGNISPVRIAGRTCTAIAFSDSGDFGGAGFLDGSYYVVDPAGKVIHGGRAPQGSMVKGIAVSANGRYAAIHYGSNRKDHLRVIDIGADDGEEAALANVHPVKTSLHVNDEGYSTIVDGNRILRISKSGGVKLDLGIPPKRYGHSSIACTDGLYAVSYTMQTGSSRLVLFRDDGTVLMSKEFPAESFLDASLDDALLLVRGSDSIYCYSIRR